MVFSYCFKITSSVTVINLPYQIQNSSKLRVNFVSYKTASVDQKLMTFKISHFDTNFYYDGTNLVKYTKSILLPPTSSTPVIYENQYYGVDVNLQTANAGSLASLRIETTIDNAFSSDISGSNPIFIELTIS